MTSVDFMKQQPFGSRCSDSRCPRAQPPEPHRPANGNEPVSKRTRPLSYPCRLHVPRGTPSRAQRVRDTAAAGPCAHAPSLSCAHRCLIVAHCRSNPTPGIACGISLKYRFIADVLKGAGYRTAALGPVIHTRIDTYIYALVLWGQCLTDLLPDKIGSAGLLVP